MIDIQRFGDSSVAANNGQYRAPKMSITSSSSGSRIPLTLRNPNSIPQSSSGSSEGSLHKESVANRLSTLESSDENNKGRISSSGSLHINSLVYPIEVGSEKGDSSLITHTGAVIGGGIRPHPVSFQRSNTTASVLSSIQSSCSVQAPPSALPSTNSQIDNDENVVIEEKRRKVNGDGYTVHRYLRGRLLGKGGFAKVYMCTALDTSKTYAVKVVPKANLMKSRARQKLQTEIKIHRILKHKYICDYKHFFEDRNNCYILLELCHNQSMNEMIKRRKRLTEPEAAYYILQTVEAVEYMHENCVIHRDLKLGNLFLDRDLVIKVGDLGLATKLESADEKRKTICGTPNYIAPEVILGSKETRGHSFEVDVWSMGVILYTLLVGKPPYEAKDVKATYQRIIANQYSFPSHIDISCEAKDLISLMLQSKPEDRPSLLNVKEHAFFTSGNAMVPTYLPLKVLHMIPEWTRNAKGEVVIVESKANQDESVTRKSSQPVVPRPALAPRRCFPFGIKDPNTEQQHTENFKAEKRSTDVRELFQRKPLKTFVKAASGVKPTVLPAFEILDESEKIKTCHPNPPQSRAVITEDLISKADALSLLERTAQQSDNPPSSHSAENDSAVLYQMLERITDVLDVTDSRRNSYRGPTPRATSRGSPETWVRKYVDYTSKYGLGFLLNNGCSGVHFNDSTKAVLEAEGDCFEYIERRKAEIKEADTRRTQQTCEKFTLNKYPKSLEKKVTLLTHFRNYLVEQQKKVPMDDMESLAGTVNAVVEGASLVYLKKWVRTKHAILFRLSNNTVQIVFYDQTEILLTADERFVTYVDKQRCRATYYLNDELVGTNPELAKRIKYSKEILLLLLTGHQRA